MSNHTAASLSALSRRAVLVIHRNAGLGNGEVLARNASGTHRRQGAPKAHLIAAILNSQN